MEKFAINYRISCTEILAITNTCISILICYNEGWLYPINAISRPSNWVSPYSAPSLSPTWSVYLRWKKDYGESFLVRYSDIFGIALGEAFCHTDFKVIWKNSLAFNEFSITKYSLLKPLVRLFWFAIKKVFDSDVFVVLAKNSPNHIYVQDVHDGRCLTDIRNGSREVTTCSRWMTKVTIRRFGGSWSSKTDSSRRSRRVALNRIR